MDLSTLSRSELLDELKRRQADLERQDPRRLVHELQTHQIELELQNRELRETHSALEESRQRYVDLYDFAPISYFTFDAHGRIVDLNLTGAALLGLDRAAAVGRLFTSVAPMSDPTPFWRHLQGCFEQGERVVSDLEIAPKRPERANVVVQAESTPLVDEHGVIRGMRTVLTDVTARKEAERELARMSAVERDLRQRLEVLARAQMSITERIPGASLVAVLQAIVDQARALVDAEFGALGIVTSFDRPFHPWVHSGMPAEAAARLGRAPRPTGLLGVVARTGEAVRVRDLRQHPMFGGFPEQHPAMTSFLGVPIRHRLETIGHLYLANKRFAEEFSVEDQQTIEMLSARVGPSLELARLQESEAADRARIAFLNDVGRLLSETLDSEKVLTRLVDLSIPRLADCAVLFTLVDGSLQPTKLATTEPANEPLAEALFPKLGAGANLEENLIGRAFASGEVACEPDCYEPMLTLFQKEPATQELVRTLGLRSVLAVPFKVGDRVFGVLVLGYCESRRRYEDADIVLAGAVCERAALAIENAGLLERVQKAVRSRDDMLAFVAHDLRNPISAIYMLGQAAEQHADDPEAVRRHLATIQRRSHAMSRLVSDLLDAAALDAGAVTLERRTVDAAELVEDALGSVQKAAAEKRIRVERDVDGGALAVLCDRERIVQVLGNLLGNSIKFTPADGTVVVAAHRRGNAVELAVSDDGPGISQEMRAHLFERYSKGQQGGTGLGLYIAKRIVRAHGGDLRCEPAGAKGSKFSFMLPSS